MENKLIEFIADLLCINKEDLNLNTDLLDLCIFDYVEFFDIIVSIEEEFKITLAEDEIDDIEHIRTIGKINNILKEKTEA